MKIKLLLGIFLFAIIYSLFPNRVHAQFSNPNANYLNTNPDVPQNFHTYTQSVFIEIAAAVSCQLSGIDPVNPASKCLGIDPKTQKIGFVEGGGGAIGVIGNLLAATFYIPVSTHDYGAYLAGNFGIAKKTYAEGPPEASVGFRSLLPTLKLWQTMRNMTYLIFVILFVIIGLGIMFRIKIDPRTVMTLQNQIPKIIIALVLVTFSYAIAGFLIDMMYVAIYLILTIFAEQGIGPIDTLARNPFEAVKGIGGMGGIAGGVAGSIAGIVNSIFDGNIGRILAAIIGSIIGGLVGGAASHGGTGTLGGLLTNPIGTIMGPVLGLLSGGIIGGLLGDKLLYVFSWVITYLIIIIAIFSALLRLWFQLIKSYIYVLINVVLAPFYIASGLIPGKSGFGTWIRSILANLSVFPVTIAMFLFGKAFIDGLTTQGEAGTIPFIPPLTGAPDPSRFAPIIGLGIILMTPEVVNIVRDALKAPEFKYSATIGKSIAGGAGVATAIPRETVGTIRAYTTSVTKRMGETGLGGVMGRIIK